MQKQNKPLKFVGSHKIQELQSDKTWLTIAESTTGYNADIIVMSLKSKYMNNSFRSVVIGEWKIQYQIT